MDKNRLQVIICSIFATFGTNLEELLRSTDDLSEEIEKPFGPVKDKLFKPTVVEKFFLQDIDCGINPENYNELQEKIKTSYEPLKMCKLVKKF